MGTFHLHIATPDGSVFDGDAHQIALRCIDGEVSILAGHTPFASAISAGECRVYIKDNEPPKKAACTGGIVSVLAEDVWIAATTFEWAEDIDIERALRAKAQSTAALKRSEPEAENFFEAKLKRAMVRLMVGGK